MRVERSGTDRGLSGSGAAAQVRAGIRQPIRWHDLRHQFVSLLIAAGKHPLYIAEQAGHADPGFTLKRYGHLFKTIKMTPVEWPEDLLWPSGFPWTATQETVSGARNGDTMETKSEASRAKP